jgi:hypothetical protein
MFYNGLFHSIILKAAPRPDIKHFPYHKIKNNKKSEIIAKIRTFLIAILTKNRMYSINE